MGYAYYDIGDGMERGYAVPDKCHKEGCEEDIDRGLAFLCYGCQQYFCSKHLYFDDHKHDCFAGESAQVCWECIEGTDEEDFEPPTVNNEVI